MLDQPLLLGPLPSPPEALDEVEAEEDSDDVGQPLLDPDDDAAVVVDVDAVTTEDKLPPLPLSLVPPRVDEYDELDA